MKKKYDIKTFSSDRVLNKKQFYGKIMQKYPTKAGPRLLFNFGKITQNSHCMHEIL